MRHILKFCPLFLAVFILFSCSNSSSYKDGCGKLSLKLPSAKTERAAENVESLEFTVLITNQSTSEEKSEAGLAGQTFSFELDAGFYDVKITAYNSDAPETILYEGEKSDIELTEGETTTAEITLKKLNESSEESSSEAAETTEEETPEEAAEEQPEEEEEIVDEPGTINLSKLTSYTLFTKNLWGSINYSTWQNDGIDIADSLKATDALENNTYNIKWSVRSTTDIKNLYMWVVDSSWKNLIPDKDILNPVATSVKAGEKFEIDRNINITGSTDNGVYVYFACGKDDVSVPFCLYTGTEILNMADFNPPTLEIVNQTIKVTAPGKKYLEILKAKGCDGYCIGIETGYSESVSESWQWIDAKTVHLSDEDAFTDIDFSEQFTEHQNEIENKKIAAVIDFYKDIDNSKVWLAKITGSVVTYTSSSEQSEVSLQQ